MSEPSGNQHTSCPLCSRKTWAQQEQDLWRLERWLHYAENKFRTHERMPTNMEQLEDTAQEFRELSLDLDSHKNIIMSLNVVVMHVAEHAAPLDGQAAAQLRDRLSAANNRWDSVCKSAARIQGRLQAALMQNEEYHRTVREIVSWLEKTEDDIQKNEPIDLIVETRQLRSQLSKFQDLHAQLTLFEPRVASMREIADQVFAQSTMTDTSSQLRSKLTLLSDRSASLLKICTRYKQLLGETLKSRGESVLPPSSPSPSSKGLSPSPVRSPRRSPHRSTGVLSSESLYQSAKSSLTSSVNELSLPSTGLSNHSIAAASVAGASQSIQEEKEECSLTPDVDAAVAAVDTTVLQRGYRFFGRVIRTALPIQAVMLLVLGVASLVPDSYDTCATDNTFTRSLEFALNYPDGAPPI